MTTRLFVGILTPAMRAKAITPAAGRNTGHLFTIHLWRRDKRKHDAPPPRSGLASSKKLSPTGCGVFTVSPAKRQPLARFFGLEPVLFCPLNRLRRPASGA